MLIAVFTCTKTISLTYTNNQSNLFIFICSLLTCNGVEHSRENVSISYALCENNFAE